MKRMRVLLFLVVMAGMMSVLAGCGQQTVKLDKYVTITANGYDSVGTASYDFDYEAFEKDYSGKIKLATKDKNEVNALGLMTGTTSAELFLELCVDEMLDKSSGLSNGDVVTLEWICSDDVAEEYFNVKLDYSNITYKVSGLEEVGTFNPFDYVSVSFSGIAPNGSVVITPDSNKPELQYIVFRANKIDGLKEGDTVTVTASIAGPIDNFVERYGSKLEKTEESYTVGSLARYISDISDIPEDLYNKMDNQLHDSFYAYAANRWEDYEHIDDFALVGNYLVTLKDGVRDNPHNYLYYIYKVTYSNKDVQNFEYYWYGYYEDIILLEDGICSVDLSGYTISEASKSFFGDHKGDYVQVEGSTCYVAGYLDLDTFFNKQIVSKIEKYEYKKINKLAGTI